MEGVKNCFIFLNMSLNAFRTFLRKEKRFGCGELGASLLPNLSEFDVKGLEDLLEDDEEREGSSRRDEPLVEEDEPGMELFLTAKIAQIRFRNIPRIRGTNLI